MKEKSHSPVQPKTRPDAPAMPPTPRQVYSATRLTAIFNEWNRRYSVNPDEFSDSLDADSKPIEDYGEYCAVYFQKLSDELYNSVT